MKSDLKMKIEPARTFDYPIFVYTISRARTLLRFDACMLRSFAPFKINLSRNVFDVIAEISKKIK